MKYEFAFPDVGEGIMEGVITKWLVKVGDPIEEGQSLVEVETDKVTTEIPSPRSGKILELKFEEGDIVEVEQVFVVIDTSDGVESQETQVKVEAIEEETAGVVGEVIASSELIPPSREGMEDKKQETKREKVLAVPLVRQMAKDLAIDINQVEASGPGGRVVKEDVLRASEKDKTLSQVQTPVEKHHDKTEKASLDQEGLREERIPLTRIRKTIADQMSRSRFTIPHTTAMDEVDVSNLVEFRNKYKERFKEEDISLTYLPFILKALVKVLKEYPEFNSSYDEESQELVLKYYYHIGIATDTDRGLMVPVLRDVDKKSIVTMAEEILDLSTRAKENKIDIGELKGSSFSLTNYGSIGGLFGIPIINYPESAILGLGRIVKKPIIKNDKIIIGHILPLSLSYDHRVIDGASGARFLNLLGDLLSDPEMLLLRT